MPPDEPFIAIPWAVEIGVVPGVLEGLEPRLFERDVARHLSRGVAAELLFFPALVFDHRHPLSKRRGDTGQVGYRVSANDGVKGRSRRAPVTDGRRTV